MFGNALRRLLNRLPGRSTHTARTHIAHGNALSEAGRPAEAAAAYQAALEIDAWSAYAHYRLGLAWRDLQKFDDAVASYRMATAIRPDYIEAHNNLGVVLQMQGRLDEALACYRTAVELSPDFGQPYLNFGRLCELSGDHARAADCYRRAIAHGIETEVFDHLLNAVTGNSSARAPAAYARAVFDDFAARFDQRLVNELEYRIPELLAQHIGRYAANRRLRVLDLGCGTGLCGRSIAARCDYLVGVDVSPAMLAKARERGVYHELAESDLEDYLRGSTAGGFDAVLAADVFVYLGDLTAVFSGVRRVLKSGGLFAFSIEEAQPGCDFVLRPSGRYAQSADYVRRLAARHGWREIDSAPQRIRGSGDSAVLGRLFVLGGAADGGA